MWLGRWDFVPESYVGVLGPLLWGPAWPFAWGAVTMSSGDCVCVCNQHSSVYLCIEEAPLSESRPAEILSQHSLLFCECSSQGGSLWGLEWTHCCSYSLFGIPRARILWSKSREDVRWGGLGWACSLYRRWLQRVSVHLWWLFSNSFFAPCNQPSSPFSELRPRKPDPLWPIPAEYLDARWA